MTSRRYRIDVVRERMRESLLRGIEAVDAIILTNRKLAESPGHRESAEQRVREGESERARLHADLAALDAQIASDHAARDERPQDT